MNGRAVIGLLDERASSHELLDGRTSSHWVVG